MKVIFPNLILLLLLPLFSVGQGYLDIVKTNYEFSPSVPVKDTDEDMSLSTYNALITLPIELNNGNILLTGLRYNQMTMTADINFREQIVLKSMQFRLGSILKFENDWDLNITGMGSWNSEWDNYYSEDLVYGIFALTSHRVNNKLRWSTGVYFSQELSGPFITPLIGLDYQPNRKWNIFGTLPIDFTIARKLSSRFNTGLYFKSLLMTYGMDDDFLAERSYVENSPNNLFVFLEYISPSGVGFRGMIGHSIFRKIRFYDAEEQVDWQLSAVRFNERNVPNMQLGDGLIIDFSLFFRVSTR
ncbi:MAG: hypothetical protein CL843_08845 [Crocinitomicaceae bacterium]|nr:hypothetical protein [Crocinitomicaceae bacterium]|tara:strand:+ start:6132 stop:7034 length:903 start_codon:yes stop_codon:yes gene_type:complete